MEGLTMTKEEAKKRCYTILAWDRYAQCPEGISKGQFAAGKGNRPNRRRCTAHVSTGSVSDTIVTKRFGNSRLTCVCRTKIY